MTATFIPNNPQLGIVTIDEPRGPDADPRYFQRLAVALRLGVHLDSVDRLGRWRDDPQLQRRSA